MTSLDSSAVGWMKFGNGENGVSALTFFGGRGSSDTNAGERDRFMLYEIQPSVAD